MKKFTVVVLTIALLGIAVVPTLAMRVFPAWSQGFEKDTAGWIGADIPGAEGWCGDITRYERGSGPVLPSKGYGYAVVENGSCNEYWMGQGWMESGPYAPFGGYSDSWPQSGFVATLDIYLDPDWADGTSFDYYVSMRILNENTFRYLLFSAVKESGNLMVAGNEISEAGWYTFRVRFREEEGYLAVGFELAQNGMVLFTQPVTNTAFTGEDISFFEVSNIGTGYSWFDSISDWLQLPIDHHKYRPVGKEKVSSQGRQFNQ